MPQTQEKNHTKAKTVQLKGFSYFKDLLTWMVRVCNIGTKVPGDFWVWLSDSMWMPEPRAAQDASAGDEQAAELAALVMQWKAVVVICWQCVTGRDGLLCRRWSEWWMSGGKLHCSYISNLKKGTGCEKSFISFRLSVSPSLQLRDQPNKKNKTKRRSFRLCKRHETVSEF